MLVVPLLVGPLLFQLAERGDSAVEFASITVGVQLALYSLAYMFWLAIAIFVGLDAARLGARRGRLGGSLTDMGPVAWFFSVALIPVVGVTAYLLTRGQLRLLWTLDAIGQRQEGVSAGPGQQRHCTRCGSSLELGYLYCSRCGEGMGPYSP
jgi:hypothetical protein